MTPFVYTAITDGALRSDVRCFSGEGVFARQVMEAKRYKILPHLFFPQRDVTIWIDGNVWLKQDVADLLGEHDLVIFRHPFRATVWQEFATLKSDPRFAIPFLQNQMAAQEKEYRREGLPGDAPLFECNFMIRRNVERVNRMMDAWWAQVCRWQWRDQVSFPYVLWKHGVGVRVNAIVGNIRTHPSFTHVDKYA